MEDILVELLDYKTLVPLLPSARLSFLFGIADMYVAPECDRTYFRVRWLRKFKSFSCLFQERERQFEIDVRRTKGLEVKRMLEDGNCLFRAVADQVYGDSEAYDLIRQMCIDYMVGYFFMDLFFKALCVIKSQDV